MSLTFLRVRHRRELAERARWILDIAELAELRRPATLEEYRRASGRPTLAAARRAVFRFRKRLAPWGRVLSIRQERECIEIDFPALADFVAPHVLAARRILVEALDDEAERKELLGEVGADILEPDELAQDYFERKRSLHFIRAKHGIGYERARATLERRGAIRDPVLSVEARLPSSRVREVVIDYIRARPVMTVRDAADRLECSTRAAGSVLERNGARLASRGRPRHRAGVMFSEEEEMTISRPCPECAGTGRVGSGPSMPCGLCGGNAVVRLDPDAVPLVRPELAKDGKVTWRPVREAEAPAKVSPAPRGAPKAPKKEATDGK